MGRLVIAHHKSYHPYRRDNIERVRRDEEQAALQQAVQEGKMSLADSEARIDLLRSKAGISTRDKKPRKSKQDDEDIDQTAQQPQQQGHINFFQDLEMNEAASVARITKKTQDSAVELNNAGIPLAPSAQDLNPWYSTSASRNDDEGAPETPLDHKAQARKDRDFMRKANQDPLASITQQLAGSSSSSSSKLKSNQRPKPREKPSPPRPSSSSSSFKPPPDPQAARLSRESSERQRAQALIARKKKEKEAAAMLTPSTVYEPSEYGDMFNREDVEAAKRGRDRGRGGNRWDPRSKGWGSDDSRYAAESRRHW